MSTSVDNNVLFITTTPFNSVVCHFKWLSSLKWILIGCQMFLICTSDKTKVLKVIPILFRTIGILLKLYNYRYCPWSFRDIYKSHDYMSSLYVTYIAVLKNAVLKIFAYWIICHFHKQCTTAEYANLPEWKSHQNFFKTEIMQNLMQIYITAKL